MKTTVDISAALLAEAKTTAREKGVTLRELIEKGLRHVIAEEKQPMKRFVLKDGSVPGDGLAIDYTWPEIRREIYEGRGE